MSDGLNGIRAIRVWEILNDFRSIQSYLSAIRANPSADDYNEEGYMLLRRCAARAEALLAQPFNAETTSRGDEEQDRAHLRRIITDAAVRRFKAQKIYMFSMAALRWINARSALLQGQRPQPRHAAALQQISRALRTEMQSITDQRVQDTMQSQDAAQGKWLNEDPSLDTIQRLMRNGNGQS